MKITNNLQIAFFLFFLASLTSCNLSEKVIVGEPESLDFAGFKNNSIKVSTSLPIQNDAAAKLKIKEIHFDVRINGKFLGTVDSEKEIVIPGRSNESYDLEFNLKIKNILLGASTFYSATQNKNINITFDGFIKTTYLGLPKKIEFKRDL
jgi:LEA14-like dessication related protein